MGWGRSPLSGQWLMMNRSALAASLVSMESGPAAPEEVKRLWLQPDAVFSGT